MMIGNDGRSEVKLGVITTDMQIDQAWRNVVARDIDRSFSRGVRNIAVHASDFPVQQGDIHLPIDLVGQIDHMPTLEDRIVSRSFLRQGRGS